MTGLMVISGFLGMGFLIGGIYFLFTGKWLYLFLCGVGFWSSYLWGKWLMAQANHKRRQDNDDYEKLFDPRYDPRFTPFYNDEELPTTEEQERVDTMRERMRRYTGENE